MNALILAVLSGLPLMKPALSRVEIREVRAGKAGECSIAVSVLVPGAPGAPGVRHATAGEAVIATAPLRTTGDASKLSEPDAASTKETIVAGELEIELRVAAPHGCVVSAAGAGSQEQLLMPVVAVLPPGRYQVTFYLAKLSEHPFLELACTSLSAVPRSSGATKKAPRKD